MQSLSETTAKSTARKASNSVSVQVPPPNSSLERTSARRSASLFCKSCERAEAAQLKALGVGRAMETFYDSSGHAVAYIDDDGESIYLWNGQPVAWVDGDSIYSYSGHYLGWLQNGWVWDLTGRAVFFTDS